MKTIYTEKAKDIISLILRPSTYVEVLEGTVRSSKTISAIDTFFYAVKQSKERLHLISAKDYDAINDNILESNGLGLTSKYSDHCSLTAGKIGSNYVRMKCLDDNGNVIYKKILLAGYSDAKKWQKILGKTFGVILIDEVNIASEMFIDECFARQVSVENPKMIWTLNGDNPDHFIYTKYINHCKLLYPLKVPQSIKDDMDKVDKRDGWYYSHWTMLDNPIMTSEKIERASSIYPIGSYYYTIKILGIRGVAEGSIFAQYIKDDDIFINLDKMANEERIRFHNNVIQYSIGLDLGNNDAKVGGTVLSLSCMTKGFEYAIPLDTYKCTSKETNSLVKEITAKCGEWYDSVPSPSKFDAVWIDSYGAIQLMLETLRIDFQKNRLGVLKVLPCLKFGDEDGRRARLDFWLMMINQKRLKVNDTKGNRELVSALKKLVYNKKDALPLDNNQAEMDLYDASSYSFTPHIRELTRVGIGGFR